MVEGQIAHEGSLEHDKQMSGSDVQAQRAVGAGFSHNEVNPANTENRLIRL
jgi:redox-sensitive bicupin YhaK (pirin superfamily)